MFKPVIRLAAFAFASAALAAVVPPVNLVVNGDFEGGEKDGQATGWNPFPKNFRVVKNAGENGSTGLVYENEDPKYYAFPSQLIKVEPGALYELSLRVMSEKLATVNGNKGSIKACIECRDAKGNYLEGMFGPGVSHTRGQWKTLKFQGKIPSGTVRATVSPYIPAGSTGKVHFDSIRVERIVRQPVSGLYSSPYRGVFAAGDVTLVAGLDLAGANVRAEDYRPVFIVPTATGGAREVAAAEYGPESARVTLQAAEFPMGRSKVRFELRGAKTGAAADADRAEASVERVKTLPRRTVTFDARRRAIVDGKPFFPLGMYWSENVTDKELELYAAGPFNCVMNYHSPGQKDMDAFHAHGLKVLYAIQSAYGDGRSFSSESNAVKWVMDKVNRFKDHPALLAWYVNDERGLDYIPQLVRRQQLLEREDPNHPTWAVMYQIPILRSYMETCDILGTDPYPVGNHKNLDLATSWVEATVASTYGIRPVWQVPQAFDWGVCWKDKNDKTRYPSEQELKIMFWQAIAGGANGLVAYNFTHLREMEWKTPRAKTWADTCRAGAEIRRFIPVLLGPDEPPAVSCDSPKARVRAWRDGEVAHVLVVNAHPEPVKTTVSVGGGFAKAASELGPSPSASEGGRLAVEIPPLTAAMWRLTK